ncbi:hypothetical protein JZ751_025372 [Albula glossodonta]|uniref:SH3 domain-containing protein n=1 Tax=Albula glossodonta TaxID=121402 RepID=A0A8T2NFC3_9TELE|nr:hypothetical protein JZ751_025372 [Albula glossodonta]
MLMLSGGPAFQARNKAGHVGYVPEKYLQFPTSNSLLSMLQSLAALDARSHTSSNSTEPELASGSMNGDANLSFVKAMYDYEGQTDDELSFPEGAIIRILNKDNQEDDGFWEGEFNGRVSPSQQMHSSLPPLPLYDQPPCSPYTTPDSGTAPPFPRSPSVNGDHKLTPLPHKGPAHSKTPPPPPHPPTDDHSSSLVSDTPGFSQPPRFTPDGGPGKLRPVRAAPPPPKQHPRRQVEKTEEVEITLV